MDPANIVCISSEKAAFHTVIQWPLQLVWQKPVLKWIGPEMPRSMIATWTGRQKWNWSSIQFYPRLLQSRSQVTYDCGWVTQAFPSSGSRRTQGKYPSSMLKLQKVVKYPMATNWKPFGIYLMRSWNLKGTNYFQWLSFGLGASKGQNHLTNGWPMYTILWSYVTTPQPPRKGSSEMS